MSDSANQAAIYRRRFLQFLAGSPLLAQTLVQETIAPSSAANILNVKEFEELARKALPPAHWGYVSSGVDDDRTLKANIDGYEHVQLRPRRLVNAANVDTKIELFGTNWDSPLFLSPVGGQKMFHAEGELAAARAARSRKALQILSTQTSISVEDVTKARGVPPWYQMYMPSRWEDTERMVKRVEDNGCPEIGRAHV